MSVGLFVIQGSSFSDQLVDHQLEPLQVNFKLAPSGLYCYSSITLCNSREFLIKNTWYSEHVAMKLLSNHGQWKLLIDLAKNRGLLGDALDFMTSCGQKALTQGPLSAFPVDTIPTGTYP